MSRPAKVDQIARSIFNRAAVIAGGLGHEGEALELVRDLASIEDTYELRLRTDRAMPGAKFTGRPIASQYPGKCKVCGGQYSAGDEILWSKGQGAAHLACGEVG